MKTGEQRGLEAQRGRNLIVIALAFVLGIGMVPLAPKAALAANVEVTINEADAVLDIADRIQAVLDTSDPGDVVTVTGRKTNVDSVTLYLAIPRDVTLSWQAEYGGTAQTDSINLITLSNLYGGGGTFVLDGGELSLNAQGNRYSYVLSASSTNVVVTSGAISGTDASGILATSVGGGSIEINGGEIIVRNTARTWQPLAMLLNKVSLSVSDGIVSAQDTDAIDLTGATAKITGGLVHAYNGRTLLAHTGASAFYDPAGFSGTSSADATSMVVEVEANDVYQIWDGDSEHLRVVAGSAGYTASWDTSSYPGGDPQIVARDDRALEFGRVAWGAYNPGSPALTIDLAAAAASPLGATAKVQRLLDAAAPGESVAVTGVLTGVVDQGLALTIPTGVTLSWQAEFHGSTNTKGRLLKLSGDGTFALDGGQLELFGKVDAWGLTLSAIDVDVVINSGRIDGFYSDGLLINNGQLTINDGTVSTYGDGAWTVHGIDHSAIRILGGTIAATGNATGERMIALGASGYSSLEVAGGRVFTSGAAAGKSTAIRVENSGTATITGSRIDSPGAALVANQNSAIVFLTAPGSGAKSADKTSSIVQAEFLEADPGLNNSADGLFVVAGGIGYKCVWDTSSFPLGSPRLSFRADSDAEFASVAWGRYVVTNISAQVPAAQAAIVDTPITAVAIPTAILDTAAPVSYSVSGLPGGLKFDPATRTITGTPRVAGGYPVTVTVSAAGKSDSADFTWTVAVPTITFGTAVDRASVVGVPVSHSVTAGTANSPSALHHSVIGLPPGLVFNPTTLTISGTPNQAGEYPVTVSAAAGGATASHSFTWSVSAPKLRVQVPSAQSAMVGTVVSVTIPAADSDSPEPVHYAVSGLPAGLAFHPNTREISGSPLVAGAATVTVTAASGGASSVGTFTWTVSAAPSPAPTTPTPTPPATTVGASAPPAQAAVVGRAITAVTVPAATVWPPGSASYSVSGLPAGLRFDPITRLIAGTPSAPGTATVTITATVGAASATNTFTWAVRAPSIIVRVPAKQTGAVGRAIKPVTLPVAALNSDASVSYSVTGLPAGLTFNPKTRVISGKPLAAGSRSVIVTAKAGGASAARQFTWNILRK